MANKYSPTGFREGDIVFLTAFLKGEKGKYYICQATVITAPTLEERQVYKVRIHAVADRPVGGSTTPTQASLLGREIIKRENELAYDLPEWMMPSKWIVLEVDFKEQDDGNQS